MINLASSVYIHRPAGTIFDFISAPANDFEWQYGTLASGPVTKPGGGLGAIFRTIGHLMGHRMQATYEVTEYEPNRRYAFRSLSGPLDVNTVFTLEMGTGRTQLNVTTEATPTDPLAKNDRTMQRYMQRQLRADLTMLKELLEARSTRE